MKSDYIAEKHPEMDEFIRLQTKLLEEAKESGGKVLPDTLFDTNIELNKLLEIGIEPIINIFIYGKKYRYGIVKRGNSENIIEVKTEDQNGKEITKYTVERDEKGVLTYTIIDWNSVTEGQLPVADPVFIKAIELPALQTYLVQLADKKIPEKSIFIYRGDEDTMAQAAIELPDGKIEVIEKLRDRGVEMEFGPGILKISVMDIKRCPECNITFTPKRKDQVYCSTKCGNRVRGREAYRRKKASKKS